MPKLTLLAEDGTRELIFEVGPSLRDLLNGSDLRIRSACRGNGKVMQAVCGLRATSGWRSLRFSVSRKVAQCWPVMAGSVAHSRSWLAMALSS